MSRCGIAVGVLPLVLIGCGKSEDARQPVIPVQGQVVFKARGREPIPAHGAFVVFHPKNVVDPKNPILPKGTVQADGTFRLTSYEDNDGAPEGEYMVTIVWKVTSKLKPVSEDRLQNRYANAQTTRLSAVVQNGSAAPLRFEVE